MQCSRSLPGVINKEYFKIDEEDYMMTSISTVRLCEFHFVMGRDMKKDLKNLAMYKETGSLSGVIVRVLSFLIPAFEKEHKWGKQRMSRYMHVSDNPAEKREHVHAYFPVSLYRQLKLMHQDLNFYSIAQLIREFLDYFLGLVKVYGDDVFQKLQRVFKKWKVEDEKNRLTPWQFIRQLYKIIQHLPGQNRLISIYNNYYSPFWIFRL
jgi:hypothetical protein